MDTQKIKLATKMLNLICEMAEQKEDYSLIQREYNSFIEEQKIPFPKIKWIDTANFEFINKKG